LPSQYSFSKSSAYLRRSDLAEGKVYDGGNEPMRKKIILTYTECKKWGDGSEELGEVDRDKGLWDRI